MEASPNITSNFPTIKDLYPILENILEMADVDEKIKTVIQEKSVHLITNYLEEQPLKDVRTQKVMAKWQ